MNKLFKKLLSLSLSLLLAMSVLAFPAFAENASESVFVVGEGGSATASGVGDSWRWKGETLFTSMGSLGGKAPDDVAQAYNYNWNGTTAIGGDIRYGYPLEGLTGVVTWETNMYVSGGSTGYVGFGQGYLLVSVSSEGEVIFGSSFSPQMESITVKKGSWNKIAVTIDFSNHTLKAYFNGQLFSDYKRGDFAKTYKGINFNFKKDSKAGIVAFDDSKTYNESYEDHYSMPYYTVPTVSVNEDKLSLSEQTIGFDEEIVGTSDELLANIVKSENDTIRLFTDSTMSEMIVNDIPLTGSEVLVVESQAKEYNYYSLEKASLLMSDVVFTGDDTTVGASVTFTNTTSTDKTLAMILVLKDENGVVQKLSASEEITVTKGAEDIEVAVAPIESNGLSAEVFFIEGWSTRLRFFDEIYKK